MFVQLLETGFFHADPHPGNLLVNQAGQLALIDFGLMADVPIQVNQKLKYLAQLGLPDKGRAIKGLVLCNSCEAGAFGPAERSDHIAP